MIRTVAFVGLACLLGVALFFSLPAQAREISSYARVNDDASLRISGHTIHLAGIHVPDTGTTCQTWRNPPVCGSRAVVALRFKIDGFVRCELLSRNRDRSFNGWCRVGANSFEDGDDLAAYLLQQGWAVALPDASIAYQALEKIARSRGLGLWGFPVDNIIRR
ncbi:thermonuclease family protein [Parahaliea mediterranea]|uniref:thermonuclease family protein n=1 Tax=Parahaliea mediterranea TaxID=651086 RepID=UPI000E2E5DFC|nr:thermonuclease family protein [Parahaliea mediterranea]